MKKNISVSAAVLLAAGSLILCGPGRVQRVYGDDGLQIVTTIFPEYDWVENILGDNPADAEVTMLLDNGVDLHSYQPAADDILKISTCDVFIYVGGESDKWVEDALQEAVNKDMIVIDLLDVLGDSVKEEELVEGMQEHDHEHEHGEEKGEHVEEEHEHAEEEREHAEEEHEHEEDHEYDEHVWLSLRSTAVLVNSISEALQSADPEHAETYAENTAAYEEKLNGLDAEYQSVISKAPVKTLLFGDRFPFRYLVDDYGLEYYAAFPGCSAEIEASFETVVFLADKVDELSLHNVMTIEGSDHRIAETIIQSTQTKDQQILTLNSLQSVTGGDVEKGVSYLSVMGDNLAVLKEALK